MLFAPQMAIHHFWGAAVLGTLARTRGIKSQVSILACRYDQLCPFRGDIAQCLPGCSVFDLGSICSERLCARLFGRQCHSVYRALDFCPKLISLDNGCFDADQLALTVEKALCTDSAILNAIDPALANA